MRFWKDSTTQIHHFISTILEKDIIIRPLFIGSGIFYNEFMFGIYANREFYLKAEGTLAKMLVKNGASAWLYAPKGNQLAGTTYYWLPDSIFKNPELLRKFILLSIKQMQAKKLNIELLQKASIRALPNLTVKHERALAKIGILDVKTLKTLGAVNAFIQIKQSGKEINISWFWALLAALENKHVHVLTAEQRKVGFDKLNEALAEAKMRGIRPEALFDNRADRI